MGAGPRLLVSTGVLLLLLAVTVCAEWLLFKAASAAGATWRGATLGLLALLFVPAVAAAALLVVALRRRRRP